MLIPFVPGALIATAALNVPGLDSKFTGFADTCRLPGKPPATGLTLTTGLPPLLMAVAVKFVTFELELDSDTFWVCAAVEPFGKTKLREFGFADRGLAPPVEFTFSVTGTESALGPEKILIKPTSTPEVGTPAPMVTVRTLGVVLLEEVTVSQPATE